uniref:Uncharacterized protein n=1 Tax=Timema tahoe TaxID=61484 RepID=A0A7R9FIW7_9NEOP|nr:unnamed protein product [Timema tahoe]
MQSKEVPNKFSSDEVLMILVLDTNGGSFLNYQPHHSKAKEINRKLDDISKKMEDSVDERLTRLAKGKHVYSIDNSYSFISNREEEFNEQLMSPNKAKNINPLLKTNEQISCELSPHTSKSNDSFIHSSPQTSKSNAPIIRSSPRASKSWGSPSTSISSPSKLKTINTTAKQRCQHSPTSNSKIISPPSKKIDIQSDKSSPLCPTKSIKLLGNSNHENIDSPPSPSVATLEPISKSAFKKRLNMDLDLPGDMPIYAKQDAIIYSPQSKSTAANIRSTVSQIDNTTDGGILMKISLTGLNSKNVIKEAEPIKAIQNVDQNPLEIEGEQDNLDQSLSTFNSHPHYLIKRNGIDSNKPKHLVSNTQLVPPCNNSSEIEHIICSNNTASQINQQTGKNLDNQIVCVEGLNKAYIDDINKNTRVMNPSTEERTILTPDSTYSQFVGHIDLLKTSTQKSNSSQIPQTTSQIETKRSQAISCEKNILPKTEVKMPKCPFVRNMNDHFQRSDICLSVGSDVDLVMDTDEENKPTEKKNLFKKPLKSINKDTFLPSALTMSLSKRKRDRTKYKGTESGEKDSSSDGEEAEARKRASLDLQLCSDIILQGPSQGMKDSSSTFISTSCVTYNEELNAVPVSDQQSSKSSLTTSSNTRPHSPHNERLEDVIISDQQMTNSEMSLTSNVHSHLSHNEKLEAGPTFVQLVKSSSVTTFTNAQPHSPHNERLENVSTSGQKVEGLSVTISSNAHSHLIDNERLENGPIFVQQTTGSPRTTSSNTQPHSPNNNILENLPTSAQQGIISVVGSSNAHLYLSHNERHEESPVCDSENLEEIPLCDKQMTELPATTSNVPCVAHDKENMSLADRQESPISLFYSMESEQDIAGTSWSRSDPLFPADAWYALPNDYCGGALTLPPPSHRLLYKDLASQPDNGQAEPRRT